MNSDGDAMKQSVLLRAVAIISATSAAALALTSCSLLDKNAQDKAACDKISEILLSYGQTGFGVSSGKTSNSSGALGTVEDMAGALESQALPIASMTFGADLTKWISSLRKTSSASIFDMASGWLGGTNYFTQISGHCIQVSAETR